MELGQKKREQHVTPAYMNLQGSRSTATLPPYSARIFQTKGVNTNTTATLPTSNSMALHQSICNLDTMPDLTDISQIKRLANQVHES